jgi:hypothetical protein
MGFNTTLSERQVQQKRDFLERGRQEDKVLIEIKAMVRNGTPEAIARRVAKSRQLMKQRGII